eukprot:6796176-Prymnesium_polylepis.1
MCILSGFRSFSALAPGMWLIAAWGLRRARASACAVSGERRAWVMCKDAHRGENTGGSAAAKHKGGVGGV